MDSASAPVSRPSRRSAQAATASFASQLDSDSGSDGEPAPQSLSAAPTRKARGAGSSPKTAHGKKGKGKAPKGDHNASPLSPPGASDATDDSKLSGRPKPRPKGSTKRPREASPPPTDFASSSTPRRDSASTSTASRGTAKRAKIAQAESATPKVSSRKSQKRKLAAFTPTPPPLSQTPSFSTTGQDSSWEGGINLKNQAKPSTAPFPAPPSKPPPLSQDQLDSPRRHEPPPWSAARLGTYVWVLIDPNTGLAFNPERDTNDEKERLWWPAKITSPHPTHNPLKVNLFAHKRTVAIELPCQDNVLSKLDHLGKWRFQYPEFVLPSSGSNQGNTSSLAKTQQPPDWHRNNVKRWKRALNEMEDDEDADSDEDLPTVADIISRPSASNRRRPGSSASGEDEPDESSKRKGKGKKPKRPYNPDWEAQTYDHYDIPGELILAREKSRNKTEYWPAQIQEYYIPEHEGQAESFKVMYLDGTVQVIPKEYFYAFDEDEFKTCKMGIFVSECGDDEEDENPDDDRFKDFSRRSPSPEPVFPAPSEEAFNQLSLREQFVHTKPVLTAVLNNMYEPAKEINELFMKGGRFRQGLYEPSSSKGKMAPHHAEIFLHYVKEWCLRDEAKALLNPNAINADLLSDAVDLADIDMDGTHSVPPSAENPPVVETTSDLPILLTPEDVIMENDGDALPNSLPSPTPSEPELLPPPSSLPVSVNEEDEGDDEDLLNDVTSQPNASETTSDTTATVAPAPSDDTVQPRIRPPRQKGYLEFEALPTATKISYCVTVLNQQCVRQILLWRNGLRKSVDLLSPEEEQDLYEQGNKLLAEVDWVIQIKQLRELAEKGIKEKKEKKLLERGDSRLRRAVKVDYKE